MMFGSVTGYVHKTEQIVLTIFPAPLYNSKAVANL